MAKTTTTWLPIVGNCDVQRGVLKYKPEFIEDGERKGEPRVVLMKSNHWFENGTITLRAKIRDGEAKVQIGLSKDYQTETFAGLNIGSAAYGMAAFRGGQWGTFSTAASGTPPPIGRDLLIKVQVAGSEVTLWVDDVQVARGTYPIRRAPAQLGARRSAIGAR